MLPTGEQDRFPCIAGAGQRTDLLFQEGLNMHQAQRDEGANLFHLGAHIERLILFRSDELHAPQTASLLVSFGGSCNTFHDRLFSTPSEILNRSIAFHRASIVQGEPILSTTG